MSDHSRKRRQVVALAILLCGLLAACTTPMAADPDGRAAAGPQLAQCRDLGRA